MQPMNFKISEESSFPFCIRCLTFCRPGNLKDTSHWEGFLLYVSSRKFANWRLQRKSTETDIRHKTFISSKKLTKTGTYHTVVIRMYVLRIRNRFYFQWLNSDPHWECGSGPGSRRAKRPSKKEVSCFAVLDVLFEG